jgi:hypothetical protein
MILSIKSQKDLNDLVDSLALEIVDANIYHRLLDGLSKALDENNRAYIQSKTYWYLATEALKDSILVRLCRFYDQEKNSLCLYNLLETIKHHVSFFDKESFKQRLKDNPFVESLAELDRSPDLNQLDIDIKFSSNSNPIVKKLIVWRNNIIAHRASKNVLKNNKILEKHPLTTDEIKTLLDEGFSILNRYLYLYKVSSWSRQIVGHEDYKSIFSFMNLGLEKWDMDRKAELEKLRGG